jgi:excisionase family DNA binding protein
MLSDILLTVEEAAAMLQVKPGTLYSWASQGKIPFRKVGSLLRFDRGELMAWTIEQATRSAQPKARRAKLSVVK